MRERRATTMKRARENLQGTMHNESERENFSCKICSEALSTLGAILHAAYGVCPSPNVTLAH